MLLCMTSVMLPTVSLAEGDSFYSSDGDERITFNFRVNKILLESDYLDNRASLEALHRVMGDSLEAARIERIEIIGTASPEGAVALNASLARERAQAVKNFIGFKYPYVDQSKIETFSGGADWEWVYSSVEADPGVPAREKVLEILSSDASNAVKEARLRSAARGEPFAYIAKYMLPYMRSATVCTIYLSIIVPEPEPAVEPGVVPQVFEEEPGPVIADESQPAVTPEPAPSQPGFLKRRIDFYPTVALKSNVLLWAGIMPGVDATYYVVPNAGIEYYFARRWSVNADFAYSYETYPNREELRALSAYSGELRYWFRKDGRFRGFYLGVYGVGGDYDYQDNRHSDADSYTNYTGKHWGAGLSVGATVPIWRGICLEAGLRGGFRHYYTNVYDREVSPYHNYCNYTTYTDNWGLTSVYFNLVYRFGKRVYRDE